LFAAKAVKDAWFAFHIARALTAEVRPRGFERIAISPDPEEHHQRHSAAE
jgi:hypothetical protein